MTGCTKKHKMRNEEIGGFTFPVPDDFDSMTDEQLRKFFSVTENLVGFYRKSDNTMISVGYAPKKLLTSLLFSTKDIIKNYNNGFSKRLNSYKKTGELTKEIAGTACPGMSFEFCTLHENVPMKAEVYSIKHKRAFYCLILIARQNGGEIERIASEVIPHITFEE